jgi:N-acetylated-alpha-linked acidic dipeptidase
MIFGGSAVHSLTPFLHELAQSIQPEVTQDALRRLARARARAGRPRRQPLKTPPVGALGSGSDYTAFLDHVGIASLDMGLNGRGGDGSYHSTYDNPTWFKKYIDPQFKFSVLAAQVTGVALLRLADAEVLPFDYESTAGRSSSTSPRSSSRRPRRRPTARRRIDFAGCRRRRRRSRKPAPTARARRVAAGSPRRADARRSPRLNRRLIMAERDLIEPAGLPDRRGTVT